MSVDTRGRLGVGKVVLNAGDDQGGSVAFTVELNVKNYIALHLALLLLALIIAAGIVRIILVLLYGGGIDAVLDIDIDSDNDDIRLIFEGKTLSVRLKTLNSPTFSLLEVCEKLYNLVQSNQGAPALRVLLDNNRALLSRHRFKRGSRLNDKRFIVTGGNTASGTESETTRHPNELFTLSITLGEGINQPVLRIACKPQPSASKKGQDDNDYNDG